MIQKKAELGITTLETALVSMFLCALVLAAAGVTDYLDQLNFVAALVEEKLDDSAVKPFKLEASPQGAVGLRINSKVLQAYVVALVESTQAALEDHDISEYFIEASLAKAQVDSTSGAFLGFDAAASFSHASGSLHVSGPALAFSDLTARFDQLASSRQTAGALQGAALVAVPASTFGLGQQAGNFVDGSILVGLRIFASLQGTLAGAAYRQLGLDAMAEGYKVVQLRGVVE